MHIIMNGAGRSDSRIMSREVAAPQVERLAALPKLKDLLLAGNPICTKGEPPALLARRAGRVARPGDRRPALTTLRRSRTCCCIENALLTQRVYAAAVPKI